MPTPAHLEDVSTPLCNPFDHSHGGIADKGVSVKSQESDLWSTQMESVLVGTSDTSRQDVQLSRGDVGAAVQGCPPDDGASLALWDAFRGEVSISAPATDHPTSSSGFLETDGPNLPLHTAGLSPVRPSTDIVPGDKYPLEEENCVQQPELNDDRERNSAGPTLIESSLVEQDPTSRAASDKSTDTAPPEGSTCDRTQSCHSANTIDAADPEGSDDDELPWTSRRRRTLPRTRGSHSPSPSLTPWSSAGSIDAEPTMALRRRKRLRRRKGMRGDSPVPETDDSSTSLTTSMSNRGEGERWPVQCFVERAMMGSQEMITIRLPAFDLYARSGRESALSPSDDASQTIPINVAMRGSRRRVQFSQAEEERLVELKERRHPKLSWKEIQEHFPSRTTATLQVHYSTQLKGRLTSKRQARRC